MAVMLGGLTRSKFYRAAGDGSRAVIFFYFPFPSAPQIRRWYHGMISLVSLLDRPHFPLPQQSQLTQIIQADTARLLLEHEARVASRFPESKGPF